MVGAYGRVGRQQVSCSTQCHVEVPHRDLAVRLAGVLGSSQAALHDPLPRVCAAQLGMWVSWI